MTCIMQKKQTAAHIRWMIRRDMPAVLGIELWSFSRPWHEADFIRCLQHRNCIGMVAEVDGMIAGYMVYALERTEIRLLNFAVDEDFRHQGVGAQMIAKLKAKLSVQRRRRIVVNVWDENLPAHLFFREMGFRATGIVQEFDNGFKFDSYRFVWKIGDNRD